MPSASIALSRISPAPSSAARLRPLDGVEPGDFAAAVGGDLEAASRCPGARRASTESTSTWLPNRSAISATSSGRWIAAVFTATLSAPARSSRSTSSTRPTPPPTVSGMKTCSAVRETISIVVARPSWEAEMSRKVSSSAPSASYTWAQLDRVAGVAQLLEVDALDHPAGVDVEARDDPDGEASWPRGRPGERERVLEGEPALVERGADDRALDARRAPGP